MQLHIEYELTKEDFKNFQLYYIATDEIINNKRIKGNLIVGISYTILIIVSLIINPNIYSVLFILLLIVFGIYFIGSSKNRALKRMNNYCDKLLAKNSHDLLGARQIIINDDDSLIQNENGIETKMNINSLHKLVMDSNSIYLFRDAISAIIVPKRVFANDSDMANLVDYINAKINA